MPMIIETCRVVMTALFVKGLLFISASFPRLSEVWGKRCNRSTLSPLKLSCVLSTVPVLCPITLVTPFCSITGVIRVTISMMVIMTVVTPMNPPTIHSPQR